MRQRATAGFGEPTKNKPTTMGNPHALFTTIPRDGGFDVVVSANGNAKTESGERTVTIRFREGRPGAGAEVEA